jgi:hypothetical protein
MSYCRIHGYYSDDIHGCPDCRSAQEHAEADREELLSRVSGMAEAIRAPGDYECPHCRYVALKKGASRCPLCHGQITPTFWPELEERLKREAFERKRELERLLERTRPERERAARDAELARARSHRNQYIVKTVWMAPFGFLAGVYVASFLALFLAILFGRNFSNPCGHPLVLAAGLIGFLAAIFRGRFEFVSGHVLPRLRDGWPWR